MLNIIKPFIQRSLAQHAQCTSIAETNASLAAHVKKFGQADLLYGDAPFSYGRQPKNMGHNCSPAFHYMTMSNEDLLALDFKQVTKRDSMCAMWSPMSQVKLVFEMMELNGFSVLSMLTWHKIFPSGAGAGCATKGSILPESEMLIMGRRGKGVPVAKGVSRIRGVIRAERLAHSVKPALFRDEFERLHPVTADGDECSRIEIFARNRAPGWQAWGNQASKTRSK